MGDFDRDFSMRDKGVLESKKYILKITKFLLHFSKIKNKM